MGTRASGATEKGGTSSKSNGSILRSGAPELRTSVAIVQKHEQIQDALERQTITPKAAEQMNQSLKGIMNVARLEMQYWNLVAKFGRKAPVPRSPLLRSVVGLPEKIGPGDGAQVRTMLPE